MLETSDQLVTWSRYEQDIKRPGKKRLLNQQVVERQGKLCDLGTKYKTHNKLYEADHVKATSGRETTMGSA